NAGMNAVVLRADRSKRDSSTSRTDAFTGIEREEKASALCGRNDSFFSFLEERKSERTLVPARRRFMHCCRALRFRLRRKNFRVVRGKVEAHEPLAGHWLAGNFRGSEVPLLCGFHGRVAKEAARRRSGNSGRDRAGLVHANFDDDTGGAVDRATC